MSARRLTNSSFLHCTLAHQYKTHINGTKAGRKARHGSTALHLAPRVPKNVTAASVSQVTCIRHVDLCIQVLWIHSLTTLILESWNHQAWKRPSISSSPTINAALPPKPLNHIIQRTSSLKRLTDDDSTAFLGNLFQCLTTLKWINQVPPKSTYVAENESNWLTALL